MWVDLLLIAGLVFLVDLLFVFFRLFFGFLLAFILLTFVSHSLLLRFFYFCSSSRLLNLGKFFFLYLFTVKWWHRLSIL